MQLRVLGDQALHEQGRAGRIEARGEKVDGDLEDVGADLRRARVVGGERVPVHDRPVAFVGVLEPDPVVEGAGQVADVQGPGGPHPGEDARARHLTSPARTSRMNPWIGARMRPRTPDIMRSIRIRNP